MKSYFFVLFWALLQRFLSPVGAATGNNTNGTSNGAVLEYMLASNGPLELPQANLRILSFNLLSNWVDLTLEYYHNGSARSVQWYAIGFGNTVMKCTYSIIFEPRLTSSNTLKDVVITERRLGDHQPGIELMSRLAYVETDIIEAPTIKIRTRIIRQRVVPINFLITKNATEVCPDNPYGYYQFPFNGSNINIIYAKGVNGAYNLSYHTPPNHGTSSIPLQSVTVISANELNNTIPMNITNQTTLVVMTCPTRYELRSDTYAERFDWPYVPRVCGTCQNNASNYNVTLMPYTTQIQQLGILKLDSVDLLNSTEYFNCVPMSSGNYPNPPVCGCTSVNWNATSLLFLIDGSGYQNNTEWREFTWNILEGFFMEVMLMMDLNVTNATSTNTSTNLDMMDVNVIIYGGLNRPLKVQKLDLNLLQSIKTDPVPMTDRYFSNLCNATNFALDYLSYSNRTSKILITLPWQSPSDELECLVCGNCTFAGIQTFTPKVFDNVDLSLIELTFGNYDDCTYLYENKSESKLHSLREWPYVLGAISDFVCVASEISILPGGNFTFDMIIMSTLNPKVLANYSRNMSEIIESNLQIFSNFSLLADKEFDVEVISFNSTDITGPPPKPGNREFTVLVTSRVFYKDKLIKKVLTYILKEPAFSYFMNYTLARFFGAASFTSYIYSVEGVPLNYTFNITNVTLSTTGIQSTPIQSTPIQSTPIQSTTIQSTTPVVTFNTTSVIVTSFNMSTTSYFRPSHGGVSILHRIRRFFKHLVWWKILIIVGASIVVFLTMMLCLCLLCTRCCMSDSNSVAYSNCNNQNVPITNTECV